jgi:hypothetical protein
MSCGEELIRINKLTNNALKNKINEMLPAFKKEYEDQDFYYNVANESTRRVPNKVNKAYPFISWLQGIQLWIRLPLISC